MNEEPGGSTADEAEAATQAAVSAIEDGLQPADPVIILSNGVVLHGKPVPRKVMLAVVRNVPVPRVPLVEVEQPGGGTRFEENPTDPDYELALEKMHESRLEATYRAAYALGTEVRSIPDGVFKPEDDEWLEELSVLGVTPDISNSTARYLSWLEHYCIKSSLDSSMAYGIALAATGIMEMEVVEAVAYFRDRAQRGSYRDAPALGDAPDGDNVPEAAAGAGAGVRGEGSGDLLPLQLDGVGAATP